MGSPRRRVPPTVLIGAGEIPIKYRPEITKHNRGVRRLTRMHAPNRLDRPLRPVALTALRSGFAVVVAVLLILVLLPAVIAVQAATI